MSEPTEAEVEAAAKVLHEAEGEDWEDHCQTCLDLARAALTAAAQVRERAKPTRQMGGYTQTIGREEVSHTIYGATEPTAASQAEYLRQTQAARTAAEDQG